MEEIKAAIIYFTKNGFQLAQKVKKVLENARQNIYVKIGKEPEQSLQEWCQQSFWDAQIIIFIGAAGIAVRTIAPFLQDKFTDPTVLVLDELGKYVIPILSGHVGRGNEWTKFLAKELLAIPVITTATDLYGKFAVDVFAAKQKLILTNRILAKEISSAVLRGEKIGFYCEGKIYGNFPKELWKVNDNSVQKFSKLEEKEELSKTEKQKKTEVQQGFSQLNYYIFVGVHAYRNLQNTLFLHPKAVTIGIGCKFGKTLEEIENFIFRLLKECQIAMESVCCLASIDKKKEEEGILKFSQKYQIPFYTFSPEQLAQATGTFSDSEFVRKSVGIGNVCERAAVYAAIKMGNPASMLIKEKTVENGITLAFAQTEWSVRFE